MRDALSVVLVAALALAVTFVAVVLRGDQTVMVPPPEAVGEQFARQVAARRYDRALQYVDEGSGITLTTVRLGGEAVLERSGAVDQVEGEPGSIQGQHSTASAVLITEAGRIRFGYRLERRRGLWKIVEWEIP